jgi:hypothetical protein
VVGDALSSPLHVAVARRVGRHGGDADEVLEVGPRAGHLVGDGAGEVHAPHATT